MSGDENEGCEDLLECVEGCSSTFAGDVCLRLCFLGDGKTGAGLELSLMSFVMIIISSSFVD